MFARIARIFRSLFSLPIWVIIWMLFLLIPANLAGLLMLDTASGRWIALLGTVGLLVNLVPVLVNGGFSRVLAIAHLFFWLPLELILLSPVATVHRRNGVSRNAADPVRAGDQRDIAVL